MKTQVYDQFGGGLLLLVMLTIAFVASEAEPKFQESAPAANAFELDADFLIVIDQERLAELEKLSSVIETLMDLSIEVDSSFDESVAPLADSSD